MRMGFPVATSQRKTAHDAFLARQDAELRLIENMKRCITTKVKHDREYALALTNVAAQANKMEKSDDLADSLVLSAWKVMTDEIEETGRLIKESADLIECKDLERLNAIYAEKRRIKKLYQEEYNKIVQQFSQIVDDVNKKKLEYQKSLEQYKLARTKFEELFMKAPGRAGKKIDDVREKYQKACRRLHQTHNEYVLLIHEAIECEKDFRQVLLPGLLDYQRNIQETFLVAWKEVLMGISEHFDFTSRRFYEMKQRTVQNIKGVTAKDEYAPIVDKAKPSICEQTAFTFDDNLVVDTSGKLLANQLTVDNLTIDWLQGKLRDLDVGIKEVKDNQAVIQVTRSPKDSASKRGSIGGRDTCDNIETLIKNFDVTTKSLNELRCQERKLTCQAELIKAALNELGCEEAPSVCDFSLEQTHAQDETTPTPTKKPCPQSPILNHDHTRVRGSDGKVSFANVANGNGLVAGNGHVSFKYNTIFDKIRKSFRRTSVPSSPVPPPRPPRRGESAPRTDLASIISENEARNNLITEEWFHGVLPREDVVRLLTNDGDFLVRETTRNDECQTVLSVCWDGHKHFIVQLTAEGLYRFEGPSFPSIRELIIHQYASGLPVTNRSGAILKKPVLRESWEILNDDVVLLEKIGKGNFADVYKAKLKSTNTEVAVKMCRVTLQEEQKRKFLQEGRILKQFTHPNVVRLIGICVQKAPFMIVMELITGGSLLTYLRNNGHTLNNSQLLSMCRDVAAGMQYLESRGCIHRDLAARNCLVDYDRTVKISDFGMSREEQEYFVSYDGMKQIPVKWTAPEALNFGKYTSACDVWSYGILMWEIYSRGEVPYARFTNIKAREMIDSGYRMPPPKDCPDEIYELMSHCWRPEAEMRPSFEQICRTMENFH